MLGAAAGGTLAAYTFDHGSIGAVLVALATAAAIGPVEELGWRGVMLPLLQRRVPPLAAAPILGAVWGIWHVPAFLLSGTPQSAWSFAPYFVSLLAVSVVMTAAFNASSGSLLVAALAHFQLNNPLVPDGQPFDAWLFVALGAAVAWFCRNGALARDAAATDVFGSDGSRAR